MNIIDYSQFNSLINCVIDSSTNEVYLSDYNTITKYNNSKISLIAGQPYVYGSIDGDGLIAKFNGSIGITINSANSILYIADFYSTQLRKLDITTGIVTTLNITTGIFSGCYGLVADNTDTYLYITTGKFLVPAILQYDLSTQVIVRYAGSQSISSNVDGTLLSSRFYLPQSISIDSQNNLYILDGTLRFISTENGFVNTIAGVPKGK